MMRSSFRDSLTNSSAEGIGERRTVIVERHNGSFGFTLQSYGIHYRDETDVDVITYVDFVDPNGHAHKAGLRPGDVIVSINGQEVERSDHATLVAIIQSCPDRIRMVVVFENCVRKVELHMKYIRLTQLLETKAREYQEICSSERAFIARLNKTRALGSYYTIHNHQQSQVAMRRDQSANATPTASYSSKSLPRTHQQESLRLCEQMPSSAGSSGQLNQCSNTTSKRKSYLCIGKAPDCDCCLFRPDGAKSSQPETPKHHVHKRDAKPQLPRPRSVHLSCYKNHGDVPADERYLINPAERNSCAVYAGYGFGYDFPYHKHYNQQSGVINMAVEATPQQRAISGLAHKSAEDLSLSNQFHNQCRLSTSTTHHSKPQRQWSVTESSQVPQVAQQQHASPQHLDSISFYNRPSQPTTSSSSSLSSRLPEAQVMRHVHASPYRQQHSYHHQQQQQHRPNNLPDYHYQQKVHHLAHLSGSHQQLQQQQLSQHEHQTAHQTRNHYTSSRGASNHSNDEGGFDEARRFRTLPGSSSKKTELNL